MKNMLQNIIIVIFQGFIGLFSIVINQFIILKNFILFHISRLSSFQLLCTHLFFFVLVGVLITYILYLKFHHHKTPSFKKLVSILPVKMCYWQDKGKDYFIHEDVQILLKNTSNGYALIQFVLTYNQEIMDAFTRLQEGKAPHVKVVISTLNISVYITKHGDYFFMILNKLDTNNEALLVAALENVSNLVWIEMDNTITFANNTARKYINTISSIRDNPQKNIIAFDGNLYKYSCRNHQSYNISILTEVNEFKNAYEQEKSNEILYTFLGYLKEKFFIVSKDSKVVFMTEGFKSLINLKGNVYNIGDVFEVMRDNFFLPDEINFKSYISNLKNNIYFCKETESEYFSCLDGRMFLKTIIPNDKYVMMVFEDVSQQVTKKKQAIQYKNIQEFYCNNMEEGVLVFENEDNLLFSNGIVKEFVNENHISNKKIFEEHLKLKDASENLYISTSLSNNKTFTIVKNTFDNLEVFMLKHSVEIQKNDNMNDFFQRIIKEIETQFRYLNYVNENETNMKKIEQINFIYKSLHRLKIYTYSNIDYYEEPKIGNLKIINLIEFVKSYINTLAPIYNIKNFHIDYKVNEYTITIDTNLFQRCLMYLLEFSYGFFLTKNKNITIKSDSNTICFEIYVEEQFDFSNYTNTRMLFVLQKLLKFLQFEVILQEDHKSFLLLIKYSHHDK
jgi:hypothetical protein